MDIQETRLQKVKNSCKVASVVASITFIIALVSSVVFLGLSIVFIANAESFNNEIVNSGVGGAIEQMIDVEDFEVTSNISSIQEYVDSHNYVYSLIVMAYFIVPGLIIAVATTVLMGLLKRIFKIILQSESPFDDRVAKYLKAVFIAFAVVIGLTVSVPIALILGVIFVCVYNIFLYGKELQRLSDETL